MNTSYTGETIPTPPGHPESLRVREELDPDQLSVEKRRYGRRTLGKATLILFWGMRIYVVLMILLVGLQIWNTLHTAK